MRTSTRGIVVPLKECSCVSEMTITRVGIASKAMIRIWIERMSQDMLLGEFVRRSLKLNSRFLLCVFRAFFGLVVKKGNGKI